MWPIPVIVGDHRKRPDAAEVALVGERKALRTERWAFDDPFLQWLEREIALLLQHRAHEDEPQRHQTEPM